MIAVSDQLFVRPYQDEAVNAVMALRDAGKRSALAVMATGTGKTLVFSLVAARHLLSGGRRVLVLVHRDELMAQAVRALRRWAGLLVPGLVVEVEQGDSRAARGTAGGFFGLPRSQAVVASVPSLARERRLHGFSPGEFDLVVTDEAHHAVPTNTLYYAIYDYLKPAFHLGVTATPDRGDEQALGQTFEEVAYVYDMLDAVRDGWLVPIVQQFLTVDGYDLSQIRNTRDPNGNLDLSAAALDRVVREERVIHGICSPLIDLSNLNNQWGGDRPVLVFGPSVACARLMADIFNRHHAERGTGAAAAIAGRRYGGGPESRGLDMAERRALVEQFRRNELRYMTNYNVFTEGTDIPGCRIVCPARATKVRSTYCQMVGRGTRPHDDCLPALHAAPDAAARKAVIRASKKPGVLIVDPVGNAGKHKLITVADVLGGRYPDSVVAAAKRAVEEGESGRGDMAEELAAAARELERQERERRRGVLVGASYSLRAVDPFDLLDVPAGREPGWFKGRPMSDKQRGFLVRAGFKEQELENVGMFRASQLIDAVKQRRQNDACTVKQARTLAKYGYPPGVSFADAGRILDRLAAARWPAEDPAFDHEAARRGAKP